jgi:hypothetical protein
MWPAARLSAQVSFVSHLLSRTGVAGTDSRRGEIELVRGNLRFWILDLRSEVLFAGISVQSQIGNQKSKIALRSKA